jgi:glycosyltransferase involved in cell wall biosynthesis
MRISATIICYNEEENIERCLKSLTFVDEIIVVDSGSTDKTIEIAKKYTDKVFYRKFDTYGNQKNYAASLSQNDIILSIDADEEISFELKNYIVENIEKIFQKGYSAIAVPRRTFYLGKFIKNSGWYPDYKPRIYKKNKCRWDDNIVHENLIVEGLIYKTPKKLDLYHYSYRDIFDHINKMNKYTSLIATEKYTYYKNNTKIWLYIFIKPILKFLKMSILKKGIFEGSRGFTISALGAFYEFLKYLKIMEMIYKEKKKYD